MYKYIRPDDALKVHLSTINCLDRKGYTKYINSKLVGRDCRTIERRTA